MAVAPDVHFDWAACRSATSAFVLARRLASRSVENAVIAESSANETQTALHATQDSQGKLNPFGPRLPAGAAWLALQNKKHNTIVVDKREKRNGSLEGPGREAAASPGAGRGAAGGIQPF